MVAQPSASNPITTTMHYIQIIHPITSQMMAPRKYVTDYSSKQIKTNKLKSHPNSQMVAQLHPITKTMHTAIHPNPPSQMILPIKISKPKTRW